MKNKLTTVITFVLILACLYNAWTGEEGGILGGFQTDSTTAATEAVNETLSDAPETEAGALIDIDGSYDSVKDVALYIHLYGKLPENYITKSEARALGWDGGSVEAYAPGCCIGGDTFYNNEGQLPDASGRKWTECDIGTLGESARGAKRIVFSNDGLIYYTEDHYETFELLYGEP